MTATNQEPKLSFTVPVNSLLDAAIKVGSIVPAKGDKPIVSNMKFSVEKGVLEIAGTDLRAFLYHQIPDAKIATEASALVSGARLLEILKEFKGSDATLILDPRGTCRFKSKDDTLKIMSDDVRDFPTLSRFDAEPGFEILGADLLEMIQKTEFAANPEQNRLAIHGVCFELKAGRFRLVATDVKRIAYVQRQVPLPLTAEGLPALPDFTAVAPLSALTMLRRAISKDNATKLITIGLAGSYLFFRMPNVTAYALTLNGKFPAYEDGFRATLTKHIDLGVDALLALVKKITLVDPDGASFEFSSGKLSLRSQKPTIGVGDVSMPVHYTGDVVKIGFCPRFIQDALDAMTSDRCRFSFDGPKKIGLLRELDVNDTGEVVSDDYCCAVMPIVITTTIASADD
jgi:DNA polymerase III subunit beta